MAADVGTEPHTPSGSCSLGFSTNTHRRPCLGPDLPAGLSEVVDESAKQGRLTPCGYFCDGAMSPTPPFQQAGQIGVRCSLRNQAVLMSNLIAAETSPHS